VVQTPQDASPQLPAIPLLEGLPAEASMMNGSPAADVHEHAHSPEAGQMHAGEHMHSGAHAHGSEHGSHAEWEHAKADFSNMRTHAKQRFAELAAAAPGADQADPNPNPTRMQHMHHRHQFWSKAPWDQSGASAPMPMPTHPRFAHHHAHPMGMLPADGVAAVPIPDWASGPMAAAAVPAADVPAWAWAPADEAAAP